MTMLAPRWRKILRDLWNNKSRTLLVVFSISIGVAALGMVANTYIIITDQLPATYQEANPAHARIITTPFDDELLTVLGKFELVKEIEGRNLVTFQIQTAPDSWRDIELLVLPDFSDIRINKIWPETGQWPPEENEIIIERASLGMTRAEIGETIAALAPNGQQKELKIVGLAHDLNAPAGTFTNLPRGYVSYDTFEKFGYPKEYNVLNITVVGDTLNQEYVRDVARSVESKIEKSGRTILATIITDPGSHWFEQYLTPMATILGVLGIIILLLSSLLVINTISAVLAQQVRQIGMMKAVGARTYQIFSLYELSMLIIGIAALLIAVPLGYLGTKLTIGILTGIINFDFENFGIPMPILITQSVLSLFVPMFVAMIPIISGSRVTVHQALNDYGLNNVNFGRSFVDRFLSYIRGIPRPLLLSVRNTFRKKVRLSLTIIALTLGSAIFIAVISVYAGLLATLDEALSYYGFDILVSFTRPYRIEQISEEVDRVSGIVSAETFGITSARLQKPDGTETESILMLAPPDNTELINPTIIEGRWLTPGEEGAVVINTDVLRDTPETTIGDQIELNIEGSNNTWQVVGITRSVMSGPMIYTTYPYFARTMGRYGLASAVYLSTEQHDPAYQVEMAKYLKSHFEAAGINVASTNQVAQLRATAIMQFNVIFIFLMMMAILLTVVGGFGLTGTMSLNVIERTREIGVMRAIGASNGDVMRIVIVEGVLIGVISWVIGLVLAYPGSLILSNIVGTGFLRSTINHIFSIPGALGWLVVVIILATVASSIPANNATKQTVSEVLAYE